MALLKEVKVGQVYVVKVSQRLVYVEVLECRKGRSLRSRFVGKNLKTGRFVVFGPGKCRRLVVCRACEKPSVAKNGGCTRVCDDCMDHLRANDPRKGGK